DKNGGLLFHPGVEFFSLMDYQSHLLRTVALGYIFNFIFILNIIKESGIDFLDFTTANVSF
ncbi:unnamed protein product, partial [marine sediment metagenome]